MRTILYTIEIPAYPQVFTCARLFTFLLICFLLFYSQIMIWIVILITMIIIVVIIKRIITIIVGVITWRISTLILLFLVVVVVVMMSNNINQNNNTNNNKSNANKTATYITPIKTIYMFCVVRIVISYRVRKYIWFYADTKRGEDK